MIENYVLTTAITSKSIAFLNRNNNNNWSPPARNTIIKEYKAGWFFRMKGWSLRSHGNRYPTIEIDSTRDVIMPLRYEQAAFELIKWDKTTSSGSS